MDLRRSILDRKGTALVAATVTAAGIGIAAVLPAYATSDDPAGGEPQMQMDMGQMPEQMPQMHEQMMDENPGMARMHERMMKGGAGHMGQE
ncbi:MAG: hypothetical protein L0H59_08685 [Tomitella sp.]|nr:hypothetical protein [Tomitella sp.]